PDKRGRREVSLSWIILQVLHDYVPELSCGNIVRRALALCASDGPIEHEVIVHSNDIREASGDAGGALLHGRTAILVQLITSGKARRSRRHRHTCKTNRSSGHHPETPAHLLFPQGPRCRPY